MKKISQDFHAYNDVTNFPLRSKAKAVLKALLSKDYRLVLSFRLYSFVFKK